MKAVASGLTMESASPVSVPVEPKEQLEPQGKAVQDMSEKKSDKVCAVNHQLFAKLNNSEFIFRHTVTQLMKSS